MIIIYTEFLRGATLQKLGRSVTKKLDHNKVYKKGKIENETRNRDLLAISM